jgi:hypothetical protein
LRGRNKREKQEEKGVGSNVASRQSDWRLLTVSDETWTDEEEQKWRSEVEGLFAKKIEEALQQHTNPLEVGNRLGEILKELETDATKLVIPRAVRKWAKPEHLDLWNLILQDQSTLSELRSIGTSIANTMRPLAGNVFAHWVAEVLNQAFECYSLPLKCTTKGKIKAELSKNLTIKQGQEQVSLKPDMDMVIVHPAKAKPKQQRALVIISAKTTLAERVLQTITWKRYMAQVPEEVRHIRVFLVTAWETFPENDINRQRVQELDGVYVCNMSVQPYGRIKPFSAIIADIKELIPAELNASS